MSEKDRPIYICPKCGAIYNSQTVCAKCNCEVKLTPYNAVQWLEMTPEERKEAAHKWMLMSDGEKEKAIRQSTIHGEQHTVQNSSSFPIEANSPSGWISLLRGFAYLVLVLEIIVSCVAGVVLIGDQQLLYGIAVIVLGIILSFLSVAFLMVFLDMATDISQIRKTLERNCK